MQWICQFCGFVHEDEDKPSSCPVCGAPGERFSERFDDDGLDNGTNEDDAEDHFDRDLFADYEDE